VGVGTHAAKKEYWLFMKAATCAMVVDLPLGPYLPMYRVTMICLRHSHRSSYGTLRNLSSSELGKRVVMSIEMGQIIVVKVPAWRWVFWKRDQGSVGKCWERGAGEKACQRVGLMRALYISLCRTTPGSSERKCTHKLPSPHRLPSVWCWHRTCAIG